MESSVANSNPPIQVAAIDIGSNSFHIIVARIIDDALQPLFTKKVRVRLASGLDENNCLSQEAIERGITTLQHFSEALAEIPKENIRIVATHTLRVATNSGEFIARARDFVPAPIEVIPGVEEARLIYQGIAHTHASTGKRFTIDIGGGSTEFVIGEDFDTFLLNSVNMGCVSFTNAFFGDGKIIKNSFKKAITHAKQKLEIIEGKYKQQGWDSCIGSSGTIRTLLQLSNEITEEESQVLTLANLKLIKKSLQTLEHVDQINYTSVNPEKHLVIPAGLSILIAIFETFDIEEMQVSDAALREGVLYEMEDRLQHNDIRQRTIQSLQSRYKVDLQQVERVWSTVCTLIAELDKGWLEKKESLFLLRCVVDLHEIGIDINSRGFHKHSAYIIENAELPGFNQEQKLAVAALIRCCRKRIRDEVMPDLMLFDKRDILLLMRIIRLAVSLNIKRVDNSPLGMTCDYKKGRMSLHLPDQWIEEHPLLIADLIKEQQQLKPLDLMLEICHQDKKYCF